MSDASRFIVILSIQQTEKYLSKYACLYYMFSLLKVAVQNNIESFRMDQGYACLTT